MAKQTTTHVTQLELRTAELRWKIEQGALTPAEFNALPADQQDEVRQVLFEMYAGKINPATALSGLEFGVIAALKLLTKHLLGGSLTVDEQTFVTSLSTIADRHPMPLSGDTWELYYLMAQIDGTVANRDAYMMKKIEVTGSF